MKFYTKIEQAGNRLLVVGYQGGKRITERVPFAPTLYIKSRNYSEWKTLQGELIAPVPQGSIEEAKEFVKRCNKTDVPVYGNTRYLYQYIAEQHPEDEIKYDASLIRVFNIDIETAAENGFPDIETADQAILSISLKDSYSGRITVWGAKPFDNKFDDVDYLHFKDEQAMLTNFVHWWVENYPDVITGWNVEFFDMPYIANRITRILGDKYLRMLSPWRLVSTRKIEINNKEQTACDILGMSILDYIQLYKKFTYTNQESYALNHICFVELGATKLDHSEYDTFKEFYTKDWQKFIEYNIHDVRLVDQLDDKMKLLELAFTMAYDAKVNFEDVFSQVRMWDNYIYIELLKNKVAIPPKSESEKDKKYAGAYVKEPIPGIYDWVISFDLNSLYPHLIMQYNLSPETLLPQRHPSVNVDKLLNQELNLSDLEDKTLCANGTYYDTTKQGFLPKMMKKMYDERVIYKKKMIEAKKQYEKTPTIELMKDIARYNNIQMAKKISLNSAYGAIGNQHFRYYMLEIAEAITLSGQLSIRWIEKCMNAHLNKILKTDGEDYVVAMDTDSMYLNLGPFVKCILQGREKTDEEIVNFLDKVCAMEETLCPECMGQRRC
jgi:DNA polymerase elongation subunit (family B)